MPFPILVLILVLVPCDLGITILRTEMKRNETIQTRPDLNFIFLSSEIHDWYSKYLNTYAPSRPRPGLCVMVLHPGVVETPYYSVL